MSTFAKSLSKNELLRKPIKQNNNKNKSQRVLIQIPQQNSKPRIFLLTKPSKPRLVQLETQTAQPHHQKNLNLSQLHHPQEKVTATPASVESPKKTETIRIPFLPRSQVQTFSVKSNTNQLLKKDLKVNPFRYQSQNQVKEFTDHTLPENPIILQQIIHSSPSLTETSSNQLQVEQKSVKNTITKSTVNTLNLPESKIIETQDKAHSEIPLTLASMAGIELTGADMSLSQADMSGAMPPTATVEEINVPVFIDEYLQQEATTSTKNNIFTINNNNIGNNSSNNNTSNDIGNEVNSFLDTLNNFEFDINMLAENCSKDKKKALEEDQQHLHHQQQLTEVGDGKKHQLELQMMLEKILCNNNNNNNNNNNINNGNMAASIDLTDDLFKVAPYTEINDFLSPDDIDNSCFGTTHFNSEEAVDLNSISRDFTLGDCFINSQPTEIMFSSGYSQSQSQTSSQNLIYEISKAEPHIAPKYLSVATTSVAAATKMEECYLNDEVDTVCTYRYINDDSIADCKDTKILVSNPLKRNSSESISQNMLEKRLKLRLDTKSCGESVLPQQSEINTPKVIDFIDQLNDGIMGATAVDSIKTIYYDLISTSPKCVSVKSEIDDTTIDFSPPNTPASVNSISNHTSCMNTAPNSPASSIATTSNTSITTKRGRGRPAKTHSDIPDRSQIRHLSESDQKKVLERAKNNEASRKSRLKHKERDNALEREETELKYRNEELETEWEEWKKIERKLKAAVKRQYFQFRNDQ